MQETPARGTTKKPYEAPRLVVFGEVEKLTGMQQALGSHGEKLAGMPVDGRPFAS